MTYLKSEQRKNSCYQKGFYKIGYRTFHWFGHAKVAKNDLVLGSNHFSQLTQMPQRKTTLKSDLNRLEINHLASLN